MLSFLDLRTPAAWLFAAGAAALVASRRARASWPLWTLVPAAVGFIVLRPLADHHLILLATACALPAGAALGLALPTSPGLRATTLGLLMVVLTAGLVQEGRRLDGNDRPEPAEIEWAAAVLAATARDDQPVVTDQPITAFLGDRVVPGPLVDTSWVRLETGDLSVSEVLATIDTSGTPVVLVNRMFASYPSLLAAVARRYPVRVTCGDAIAYVRSRSAAIPVCPL